MKIIFLDIDGVLNSAKYDRARSDTDGNIDATRLPLLKQLVDATGAEIVLTSTWRKLWERDESQNTETGKELNRIFASVGLKIFDKTPISGFRKDEVLAWLNANPDATRFCIIDDMPFGWGELSEHFVKTDPLIGYGLEQQHIDKAVKILSNP